MKKKALTPKAKHWLAVLLSAIVAISAAVPGTLTTAFAGENGTVDYSYNSGNEDGTGSGEDGTGSGEDGTGSAVNGNIDFGAGIGDTYSNADDAEEIRVYVSDELKAYVKNQFTGWVTDYIAAIHLEYGDQHVTTTTPNFGGYYFTLIVPGDLNSTNYDSFFDGVTFLDGAVGEEEHVYFSLEKLKVDWQWEEGKLIDWDVVHCTLDLGEEMGQDPIEDKIPVKTYVLNPNVPTPEDGSDQGVDNYYPSNATGEVNYNTGLSGAKLTEAGWNALKASTGDPNKLEVGDQLVGDLSGYVKIDDVDKEGYRAAFSVTGDIVPYVIKVQDETKENGATDIGNGQYADIHVDCYVDMEVTMTYYPNFTEAAESKKEYKVRTGDAYSVLNYDGTGLPVRSGYTFLGWATESGGEVEYEANENIPIVTSAMNFYAVWQENGANTTWVTYYANYENADPEYLQFSAEIGKTHQVLNYGETGLKARDNYKFQGWATTPNGQVELAYKEGNYIDIAGAVNLYAVWEEDKQSSYTVTHKFAAGTPAEVSFTGGQKTVVENFENPAQKLKAQEITKGYVITKIEVWENSALKTEYKGNYEYMNTYLTKDVPVELVYHVEKKEDPDTSTPSEPDTSEPDDRYPPRPRPDPDDNDDDGPIEIPDESTPLAPGTDDGTGAVVVPEGPGGDDTVIDDDDVPLASLPTEEIDGDETPVTNPPKTGVKTAGSVALLAGSLAVALATLKKRHGK